MSIPMLEQVQAKRENNKKYYKPLSANLNMAHRPIKGIHQKNY
jgi:hypothetical protein